MLNCLENASDYKLIRSWLTKVLKEYTHSARYCRYAAGEISQYSPTSYIFRNAFKKGRVVFILEQGMTCRFSGISSHSERGKFHQVSRYIFHSEVEADRLMADVRNMNWANPYWDLVYRWDTTSGVVLGHYKKSGRLPWAA